jgi:hypothetical protein
MDPVLKSRMHTKKKGKMQRFRRFWMAAENQKTELIIQVF